MPTFGCKLFSVDLAKGRYSEALDRAMLAQMRLAARAFVRIAAPSVPVRTGFARGTFRNILQAAGASGGEGVPADSDTAASLYLTLQKRIKAMKMHMKTARQRVRAYKKIMRKHHELIYAIREAQQNPTALQSLLKFKAEGGFKGGDKYPTIAKMFNLRKGSLKLAAGEKGVGIPLEYYTGSGGKILKTPESGRQFATQPGEIFERQGFVYTFNFSVMIDYFNINDFMANPHTPSSPWKAFERGRAFFMEYLRTTGLKRLPNVQDFLVENWVEVTGTAVRRKRLDVLNRTTLVRYV